MATVLGLKVVATLRRRELNSTLREPEPQQPRGWRLSTLAAALERNSTLKELYLIGNYVGDDGCRHLAAALERNNNTLVLSWYSNHSGTDGAVFQTMLQSNCTLDKLYGVDGVEHILERNHKIRNVRKRKVC
jgi:hypothetical protein